MTTRTDRQPALLVLEDGRTFAGDAYGAVGETVSDEVAHALGGAVDGAGFRLRTPVIEVSGECRHCQQAHAAA